MSRLPLLINGVSNTMSFLTIPFWSLASGVYSYYRAGLADMQVHSPRPDDPGSRRTGIHVQFVLLRAPREEGQEVGVHDLH